MARLTVEDCLPFVENRFDLVLKASKRARELERGGSPKVSWDNDKPTVVALREISLGFLKEAASQGSVNILTEQEAKKEKDRKGE